MNDVFESLTDEFRIIQSNDSFFRGRKHLSDKNFYTNLYKNELISVNRENEYIEYDVYYVKKSKDEVMMEVVDLLDCYRMVYSVPEVRIGNKDWDIFFNETYEFYNKRDLGYFFEQDMLMLNRLAIAKSLLYEKKYLDISDYTDSFNYLESRVLTNGERQFLNRQVSLLCNDKKIVSMRKFLQKKFDR